MKRKKKVYAVVKGRHPGIYESWADCEQQVSGYSGAFFHGFPTQEEAIKWFEENSQPTQRECINLETEAAPDHSSELNSQVSQKTQPSGLKLSLDEDSIAVLSQRNMSDTLQELIPASSEENSRDSMDMKLSSRGTQRIIVDLTQDDSNLSDEIICLASDTEEKNESPPLSQSTQPLGTSGTNWWKNLVTANASSAATQTSEIRPLKGKKNLQQARRQTQPYETPAPNPSCHQNTEPGTFQVQPKDETQLHAAITSQAITAPPNPGEQLPATLHAEQLEVVRHVLNGDNVYITGVGGTGKSFLLKYLIKSLTEKYGDKRYVGVIAPTGIAAEGLGGCTIHSFFGIGVPKVRGDFGNIWGPRIRKRIRDLAVLVVDEVSMCSGEMFEMLSLVVQKVRNDPRAFGGIQLILSGDFLQLPPIENTSLLGAAQPPEEKIRVIYSYSSTDAPIKLAPGETIIDHNYNNFESTKTFPFMDRGFVFETQAWWGACIVVKQLKHVWRQKDEEFVRALEKIRLGGEHVSPDVLKLLKNCQRTIPVVDGIETTKLYCTNKQVDNDNLQKLAQLPGEERVVTAEDSVVYDDEEEQFRDSLRGHSFFRQCRAQQSIRFKIGAQVMLLKNLSQGGADGYLVNGSRGVVIDFHTVKTNGDAIKELHKQLDDERLRGVDPTHTALKHKLLSSNQVLPVVKFNNGATRVIGPEIFEMNVTRVGSCLRAQVPLMLAWAITVHKSQGMSLDRVTTDLGRVFACGQAYVALSRVRSLGGLELYNFDPNKVRASAKALDFYAAVAEGREIESRWFHVK